MVDTNPTAEVFRTPESLGLDTRDQVRREAIKVVDGLPPGSGQLRIDMEQTRKVDSAGLGALMLIQRHAAERRIAVSLSGVNDEIMFLLVLTKLSDLFDMA